MNYFGNEITSADGSLSTPAGASGVFSARTDSGRGPGYFPTSTWNDSNYWADVIFKTSAASSTTILKTLTGTAAAETLIGGAGPDTIRGLGGNDRIQGNGAADSLQGGPGDDTFVYARVADSTIAASDTIQDFARGADKIDLRGVDAVAGGGDNPSTGSAPLISREWPGNFTPLRPTADCYCRATSMEMQPPKSPLCWQPTSIRFPW